MTPLCQFCGADSPRQCDLEEEMGCCLWQESGQYEQDLEDEEDDDAITIADE